MLQASLSSVFTTRLTVACLCFTPISPPSSPRVSPLHGCDSDISPLRLHLSSPRRAHLLRASLPSCSASCLPLDACLSSGFCSYSSASAPSVPFSTQRIVSIDRRRYITIPPQCTDRSATLCRAPRKSTHWQSGIARRSSGYVARYVMTPHDVSRSGITKHWDGSPKELR